MINLNEPQGDKNVEVTLRVIYACTACKKLYEAEEEYYLSALYGKPRVCAECRHEES